MSDVLIRPALIATGGLSVRARRAYTARRHSGDRDAGVSTLEMVIITLGLIAVATLLVTAITLAVTRRTDQIK